LGASLKSTAFNGLDVLLELGLNGLVGGGHGGYYNLLTENVGVKRPEVCNGLLENVKVFFLIVKMNFHRHYS